MKYVYPTIFEDDDGKIGVTVPDIPHCHTFGDNMTDAIEMAKDCIEMMLASYEDDGKAIFQPNAAGCPLSKTRHRTVNHPIYFRSRATTRIHRS